MNQIHILPDPILHEKMKYVCRQMRLHAIQKIRDKIGTYAYILVDSQSRRYLFAAKRYIDWSPKSYGRVSFSKPLIEMAQKYGYTLLMLIEKKEDEESRNYIYTYSPADIISHPDTYENFFNQQRMLNFNIEIAINCEITRRREILKARVELREKTKPEQKDVMNLTVRRFL